MTFPVPPIDPNYPIPNNPFYYPDQNYLKGEYGPFIIGTGLYLDNATGTLSSTGGGGGGGVTALIAGNGINLTANTGTIIVSNTGALDIVAGIGINVAKVGGTYTITNIAPGGSPTGTVTQVNTGAGLTGGPITSSGTISLTPTGVAAATYTNPTITVDEYGRISFAAPGIAAGAFPVQATLPLVSNGLLPSTVSINPASTVACGAVRLNDTVTSTSTSQAATASSVKCAYDTSVTACTTAVTALGLATTASADATNALLTANNAELCAAQALTEVVIAQATANAAVCAAAAAQSTATTALGIGILAQNRANAAYDSAEVRVPCSAFFQKGDVLVGLGSSSYTNLTVGANGYVLTACSDCPSGVMWSEGSGGSDGPVTCVETGTGLVGGPITSSGVIALANTLVTPGTYLNASFTVNAQGQITSASGSPTPIVQITGTYPVCVTAGVCPNITVADATGTTVGVVRLYNALNSTSPQLALTAQQGKVLNDKINALCADKVSTVSVTTPLSVTTGINPVISIGNASLAAKGAVQLYNNTDSTSIALALTAAQGKNLQDQITALASCSCYIPCSALNSKGTLLSANSAGVVNAVPSPRTNGQVLASCSDCSTGLVFETPCVQSSAIGFGEVSGRVSSDLLPVCCTTVLTGLGANLCSQMLYLSGYICQTGEWFQEFAVSVRVCEAGSGDVLFTVPFSRTGVLGSDPQCSPFAQSYYYYNPSRKSACFDLILTGCTPDRGSDQGLVCACLRVVSVPSSVVF